MLFTLATVLWIVVLGISIYNAMKQKKQQQFIQVPTNRVNVQNKENICNSWILSYIRDKGGRVEINQLKEDVLKYYEKTVDTLMIGMVNDHLIRHGINTDTLEEYVELNSQERIEDEW